MSFTILTTFKKILRGREDKYNYFKTSRVNYLYQKATNIDLYP